MGASLDLMLCFEGLLNTQDQYGDLIRHTPGRTPGYELADLCVQERRPRCILLDVAQA